MKEPSWISTEVARVLHGMQLSAFGGPSGVRDETLLESALARPRHLLAYDEPTPSLPALAASYAFGIVRNHPFMDGNKRTGLVLAFTFLELNGLEVRASEEDAYETFMKLASGKLSEKTLSQWLEKHSVPRESE